MEVEFERERLFQVLHNRLELNGRCQMGNRLDDLLQDCQVCRHQVLDVRVLHLARDLASVVQRRTMHLADRRRSNRLPLELGKYISGTTIQFVGNRPLDLPPGARRHAVLRGGQGANVDSREQVWPCRGKLAGFNERATKRGGRLQDAVRATLVLKLPVPRLDQGGCPLRTFTQGCIPDEDIRGNGSEHQSAREGLADRGHARGALLYLQSCLRPKKRIRARQSGQPGEQEGWIGCVGCVGENGPRLFERMSYSPVERPLLFHISSLLHIVTVLSSRLSQFALQEHAPPLNLLLQRGLCHETSSFLVNPPTIRAPTSQRSRRAFSRLQSRWCFAM